MFCFVLLCFVLFCFISFPCNELVITLPLGQAASDGLEVFLIQALERGSKDRQVRLAVMQASSTLAPSVTLFPLPTLLIVPLLTQSSTNSASTKGTFTATFRSTDFPNYLNNPDPWTSETLKRCCFLLPEILNSP